MNPMRYVRSARGVVHVREPGSPRVLCDGWVAGDWVDGDETMNGQSATCVECAQAARVILRPRSVAAYNERAEEAR